MIAALFVETGGAYYGIADVDPWDVTRDARRYAGPWPVVAHPPCSRWCRLAGLVEARWSGDRPQGELSIIPPRSERYARGNDGGTFEAALNAVRRWGGVLEHPAYSDAWEAFGLPRPSRDGGWIQGECGGWSCHVEQGRYGHVAKKATWLYSFGTELPEFREVLMARSVRRSAGGRTGVELQSSKARLVTPPAFRDVLIGMARTVNRYRLVADSGASSGPPLLPADRVDGAAAGSLHTQETP